MAKAMIISFLVLSCFLISSCEAFTNEGNIPVETEEPFYVPKAHSKTPDIMKLKVIKKWEGTQSKDIKFNATTAPWIINSGYTRTSKLSSVFELSIGKPVVDLPDIELRQRTVTLSNGNIIGLIEDSGSFIIHITASGVKWWMKIGIE